MVRYCYIKPDLSFSGSWGEEEHKAFFTENIKSFVRKEKFRVIKYEVVEGEDFTFPDESILVSKPKK